MRVISIARVRITLMLSQSLSCVWLRVCIDYRQGCLILWPPKLIGYVEIATIFKMDLGWEKDIQFCNHFVKLFFKVRLNFVNSLPLNIFSGEKTNPFTQLEHSGIEEFFKFSKHDAAFDFSFRHLCPKFKLYCLHGFEGEPKLLDE